MSPVISPDHADHSRDGFENAFLSGDFGRMLARALPFVGDVGSESAFFALFGVLHILHRSRRKLLGCVCVSVGGWVLWLCVGGWVGGWVGVVLFAPPPA